MDKRSIELLASLHTPKPELSVEQWATQEIDYSRNPSYDTPIKGFFDPAFLPIYAEPYAAILDKSITELVICKCSRAGASEFALNSLRYLIANDPCPMLYVAGSEQSATRFFAERIKGSMPLSPTLSDKFKTAKITEHDIAFSDCLLRCTWQSNKNAFRQSGYKFIFADEISTWENVNTDVLRRRTETYAFSKVILLSSPDATAKRPSNEDPIFTEFDGTDKRKWHMPCPDCGKEFTFVLGTADSVEGLKFSGKTEAGEWDYTTVAESAYYRLPCGHTLQEQDRLAVVAKGSWQATQTARQGSVRGYHINAFLLPFKSSSFGQIAVEFLKAKSKGQRYLRVFFYEFLAEMFWEEKEATSEEELEGKCSTYPKGTYWVKGDKFKDAYKDKQTATIVTVDVQKYCLWVLVRQWAKDGSSGLVDYRSVITWAELEEIAKLYTANFVYVDCGYAGRGLETYEYCTQYRAMPCKGSDQLQLPIKRNEIDPYEGTNRQGQLKIAQYVYNSHIFKSLTLDLMRGQTDKLWLLPVNPPREYLQQAASEQLIDGKWTIKKGYGKNNHAFDAETMSTLAATIHGYYVPDIMLGQLG